MVIGDVLVSEKALDGANVGSALQQVGGETVAKGVRGNAFVDVGLDERAGNCSVDHIRMDVMAAFALASGIDGADSEVGGWCWLNRLTNWLRCLRFRGSNSQARPSSARPKAKVAV